MKIINIPLVKPIWHTMVKIWPKFCCKLLYFKAVPNSRWLNLDTPQDLRDINEKIQYLKFHSDMNEWARLADKYAVRKYVKERGLEEYLVKLYGKYDTPEQMIADWDHLPDRFVLKSNNGCGTIKIISDKRGVNKEKIRNLTATWLSQKDTGIGTVELHYTHIKPCLIAEELLIDPSVSDYSRSLIDYKLWCFHGKPYGFFVVYDRDIQTGEHIFDFYSLDWEQQSEKMHQQFHRHPIPRPKNLNKMLDIAAVLSKGHPQMRVDMYNIDGRIYLGELTMTSQGGYMDYFSKELLEDMGKHINL